MERLNDELLKELYMLELDVKFKGKRIEAIKSMCKLKGTFSTEKFICLVTEHVQTNLASIDKVREAIGSHMLESCKLLCTTKYTTVRVLPCE